MSVVNLFHRRQRMDLGRPQRLGGVDVADAGDAGLFQEKWFDFFDKEPPFQDVTSRFEDLFLSVCKRRFPREVPFMSTLSGGIDSTAICLFLTDYGRVPVRTVFGDGPRQQEYAPGEMTEYEASLFTSRKLNTSHSYVNFDCPEYVDVLTRLADKKGALPVFG